MGLRSGRHSKKDCEEEGARGSAGGVRGKDITERQMYSHGARPGERSC
jgi:hypothetical protein